MEPRSTRAETLPALYRAILDAVGDLESRGERVTAVRARRAATAAYAVWNDAAERDLTRLLEDLRRSATTDDRRPGRSRPWSRRRPDVRPGGTAASAATMADSRVERAPTS